MRVPQFAGLERFSHVMHLTSIVDGKLADDRDRLDAAGRLASRQGTVSGAPEGPRDADHSRASSRRDARAYAGAVGYLDFAGNLDCWHRDPHRSSCPGGKAYVQAGAGIVMDSNPTAEYEETRDKARALIRALEIAQQGL